MRPATMSSPRDFEIKGRPFEHIRKCSPPREIRTKNQRLPTNEQPEKEKRKKKKGKKKKTNPSLSAPLPSSWNWRQPHMVHTGKANQHQQTPHPDPAPTACRHDTIRIYHYSKRHQIWHHYHCYHYGNCFVSLSISVLRWGSYVTMISRSTRSSSSSSTSSSSSSRN